MLLVGAGQHLLRVGYEGDQLAHLPLHLRHRADQPGRGSRLRNADVEADVGPPVVLEVGRAGHLLHQLVEAVEPLCLCSLGGEDRRSGLDRHAEVEHRERVLVQRLTVPTGKRRLLGDEAAAAAPAL